MNKFYDCLKVILYPPKGLLKYNCKNEEKTEVFVDSCLAREILDLWDKGIRTTGCCCGHGSVNICSWIGVVEEDIPKMEELGYQHRLEKYLNSDEYRQDFFIPKSTKHYFDGYTEYLRG